MGEPSSCQTQRETNCHAFITMPSSKCHVDLTRCRRSINNDSVQEPISYGRQSLPRLCQLLVISCSVGVLGHIGHAQSAAALIDKLVEKGILSTKEANQLRDDAAKTTTQSYTVKSGVPEWVSALKFGGDFRGRFEGFYSDNDAYTDRNRLRYRLRFGVTASLFENFEVGLRLGSGVLDSYPTPGIDPISNNQSFQNNASKKGIFLDLAYAKWGFLSLPDTSASFSFGKMENPLNFSSMVFDHDYTPEGLGLESKIKLSEKHVLKPNAGFFILDELAASGEDPMLAGGQATLESTWNNRISTSAGVGVLGILNPQMLSNESVPNVGVGNTRTSDGSPAYDFHPVVGDASLTYSLDSFPLYKAPFPIRVFGEYLHNGGAPSGADNYGYSAGVVFGKAGKKGAWDLSYTYTWLGANAWWEELPDSNFGAYWKTAPAYSGKSADYYSGTNVKGHTVRLAYSPYNFLTLSIKWFYTDLISTENMADQPPAEGGTSMRRLEVDAVLKF